MKKKLLLLFLLLACTLFKANAREWPKQSVHMVLPFAPGGAADVVTRIVMTKISQQTGQQFVVDNRTGASGIIGTEDVARAKPDGYTFLVGSPGTISINPNFFNSIPYDVVKDFVPVVQIAKFPQMLVVSSKFSASSGKEFIQQLRKSKTGLNFGSSGNGSTGHLITESFLATIGAKANHIPFRGGGPAALALAGGHVDFVIDGLPTFASQLGSNRIRILAITSNTRWEGLPDVPTISELTSTDFDMGSWVLILAPHGTPAEIIEKFAKEASRAVRDPQVQKQLTHVGAIAVGGTPQDALKFEQAEDKKWGDTIRASGAKP
ncbi:Bug family tripartite tricarboxylate transporter substrate binding protein [Candidimonas nitroreducens]|uniref:MFS transporter n=1 Tax=Candidimonas nitroreducens TaxID=683354 RepID=A0A225MIC0_9BURK|nr:tripartite tricarboxylate transporter substrate binding protein [Candidimonas nitroreducens]OWT60053.1 MFS transporter [Candidimonas nitroreducens]